MKFTDTKYYDGVLTSDDKHYKEYKKDYQQRGFDDSVTWSLDYSLMRWLSPRLQRFLEVSEDGIVDDKLHKDIREILKGFNLALSDDFEDFNKEQVEQVDKSFELLAKNYKALWW